MLLRFSQTLATFSIALLLTGATCAEPSTEVSDKSEETEETDEQGLTADPPTPVAPSPDPVEPAPAYEEVEILWDEARDAHRIDPARISEASRQAATESPVPVLLPDDDELLAAAQITSGPTWYAVNIPAEGHVITIHGTNVVHPMPGLTTKEEAGEPILPDGDEELRVSRTHGIINVSFQRFGAAYSLDIDCQNPHENPHCAEDDYALSLIDGAGVLDLQP